MRVADTDVLGEVGEGFPVIERVVEAGIAATAAESVGAMASMNDLTLEYSRTREQFGKAIGSYQVVQHRLADMFMAMEQGRSMAMLATMSVNEPDPVERARNIAMAKVGVGQAGRYVSQSAVQMHGGIGMTEEYAVGHYFRRCMVISGCSAIRHIGWRGWPRTWDRIRRFGKIGRQRERCDLVMVGHAEELE